MMKSLASYAMRGQLQAMLTAAGLAAVALLFVLLTWPLIFVSAGIVVLVTLTQGARDSIQVILGATVALTGFGLLFGSVILGLGFAILFWLPGWLLGQVLRQSQSLARSVLTAALLGLIGVSLVYVILDNPAQWWIRYFENQLLLFQQAGVTLPNEAELRNMIPLVAGWMSGSMMAWIVLVAIIALLLGRRWQSLLYHAGAFASEFRQLRLGTVAAGAALVILVAAQLIGGLPGEWLVNMLLVIMSVFLFQGLAISHALIARARSVQAWLLTLYIVVVFTFPYGAVVLAIVGMVDNWIDIRRRIPGTPG